MEKIADPTRHSFKERLLPLPLFLLMTLAVLLMLGGALFFMYSIIIVVALNSAMAFLLIFAAGTICVGLGILSLNGFFSYKKYYKNHIQGISYSSPKTDTKDKTFKDYLTLQNISLAILLVGAICAIVSAALGAMNRDKWVQAISSYMKQNGYYSDINYREIRYSAEGESGINSIVIDLNGKNAVVIYSEEESKQSFVIINGYEKYENQIALSKTNGVLKVSEGQQPALNGALEKLLFFMFDENKIESQIKIYIPVTKKDAIKIEGKYIEAQTVDQQ